MADLGKLENILKDMGSCLLAYSGGVDSTLLLKVAFQVLGDKLLAVTAVSPTYSKEELDFARKTAKEIGARHKIIKTYELEDKNFKTNSTDRCYFCKSELFSRLKVIAKNMKLNFVIDASNLSDKKDFRPGSRAKQELNVRSPLQEAGFTKAQVRAISKKLGLATWDKPALACLASRIPYGKEISLDILKQVNQAEVFLRRLALKQVRVRHYGWLCRIEVYEDDFPKLLRKREAIARKFKKIGYNYITLDLEGYRAGSMNESMEAGKL